MATQREIKRRIKSAKNIGQVTAALEMVSAVKMRKAQAAATAGRPYSETLQTALREVGSKTTDQENPYLKKPEKVERVLLLIVASQKGLVGSMLTNLNRQVYKYVQEKQAEIKSVTWGKKARNIAARSGLEIVADFSEDNHRVLFERISALTAYLTTEFKSGRYDLIDIAYSQFVNTMTQQPRVIPYLPIVNMSYMTDKQNTSYKNTIFSFEPSPSKVLDAVLERYIEQVVTQVILDSMAAEHSARMVAMKNAHENANDITNELTLLYNKSRQSAITNEIADIAAGSLISQ